MQIRFHRNAGHAIEWWKVVVKHRKDGNFDFTFSPDPTYQAKSGTREYNGHSFPSFAYCFRGKIRVLRPIFRAYVTLMPLFAPMFPCQTLREALFLKGRPVPLQEKLFKWFPKFQGRSLYCNRRI